MQQKQKIDKISDEITYYDTSIYNISNNFTQCKFSQVRGQALLQNSEDYNMAIVRFKIPTALIPIFNFQPQPKYVNGVLTNPDPQLGIYSITYSFGGTDKQFFIYLQSGQALGGNMNPPADWTVINEKNYEYYTIYNYVFFMNLINQALQQGFYYCQHTAPFNTSQTILSGAKAPFLSFDPVAQLFSLNCSKFFDPAFIGSPALEIHFNHPLFDFFESLYFVNSQNQLNGKFKRFLPVSDGVNISNIVTPQLNYYLWSSTRTYDVNDTASYNNINYVSISALNIGNQPDISPANWTALPQSNTVELWDPTVAYGVGVYVKASDGNYYISILGGAGNNPTSSPSFWILTDEFECYTTTQSYTTLYKWETFTNLIFTSNTLQINQQNQGANLITDNNNTSGAQSTSQLPVLTDFDPLIDQGVLNRNYLQYNAQGNYRLLNINGRSGFELFNYDVYWVDQYSNQYPLFMDRSSTANVKFIFQRKGYRS